MTDKYLIAGNGGSYIRKALSESDPKRVINEVQDQHRLNVPMAAAAFPILDTSGTSHRLIHTACLDALRKHVMAKITPDLADHDYQRLLDSTLPYLGVPQLRDVPLALLKLHPERITDAAKQTIISDTELYTTCPVEIRRHMWINDPVLFRDFVRPLLDAYRQDKRLITAAREMRPTDALAITRLRRNHPTIVALADAIHTNVSLYNLVLGIFRTSFLSTGERTYCNLRFDLLMKIHNNDVKVVYDKDPCHLLVWYLDACIRNQAMDDRRIRDMQSFFDNVPREDPVYGDIAMILYGDFVFHIFSLQLLRILRHTVLIGGDPANDRSLKWAATILKLGTRAKTMIETRDFRVHKIDKEVVAKFMVTLAQIIATDDQRDRARAQRKAAQGIGPTDAGFWALDDDSGDEGADEDMPHMTDAETHIIASNQVALQVYCQYTLDRLTQLDYVALIQGLPVVLACQGTDDSSDLGPVKLDSFIQSFVSCLLSPIRPLYPYVLNHVRLHDIIISKFLLRLIPSHSLALGQLFRLCSALQAALVSANPGPTDVAPVQNKPEAFRLIAEWVDEGCKLGLEHQYDQQPEIIDACQHLVQKSPAAAGPYQLSPRNQAHVAKFLESGTKSAQ
ncbi:hypothetical protein H4R35_005960 [Dimargaris xerosporica]|nr:hypothetical protein H4R35_005960 [Dimargaris xerosporica]